MAPVDVVAVPVTVIVYGLAERVRASAVLMRSPQPVAQSSVMLRAAMARSFVAT